MGGSNQSAAWLCPVSCLSCVTMCRCWQRLLRSRLPPSRTPGTASRTRDRVCPWHLTVRQATCAPPPPPPSPPQQPPSQRPSQQSEHKLMYLAVCGFGVLGDDADWCQQHIKLCLCHIPLCRLLSCAGHQGWCSFWCCSAALAAAGASAARRGGRQCSAAAASADRGGPWRQRPRTPSQCHCRVSRNHWH